MSEQHQAEALARWLSNGGRGDPPEGLDAEALEAVYALRPDLAPDARVSVDDILADVTTGPFATTGADVVPFPREPVSLTSVGAPPTRVQDRTPRWRVFAGGAAGLLVAAAAALIVLPQALDSSAPEVTGAQEAKESSDIASYREPQSAPAPVAAEPTERALETKRVTRSPSPQKDLLAKPSASTIGTKSTPTDNDAVAFEDQDEGALDAEAPEAQALGGARYRNDDGDAPSQTAIPEVQTRQTAEFEADGLMDDVALQEEAGALPPPASKAGSFANEREEAAVNEVAAKAKKEGPPEATTLQVTSQINQLKPLADTDPLAAAQQLATWVREPATGGTLAALNAARWYQQAGRDDLALAILDQGLALPDLPSGRAAQLRAERAAILGRQAPNTAEQTEPSP